MMIGGFRLKYYDLIFLLGMLIIVGTSFYVDFIIGLYTTGSYLSLFGILVANKHKERG